MHQVVHTSGSIIGSIHRTQDWVIAMALVVVRTAVHWSGERHHRVCGGGRASQTHLPGVDLAAEITYDLMECNSQTMNESLQHRISVFSHPCSWR